MPKIVLVVAVARNGVIGRGGALPWRLTSELKRFRETTWGRPMIMGRKTFESIGRPLPGRRTIVVTRDTCFAAENVQVAHSIAEAVDMAAAAAGELGADEIMVVGGAEIYAALMSRADRIVLTEVDLAPGGDAFLPPLDPKAWREVSREAPPRGPKDEADYVVKTFERA